MSANFCYTLAGDHNVFGFDVAMNQAHVVGVVKRMGDLDHRIEGLVLVISLVFFNPTVDGVAFYVLHDEVGGVARFSNVQGANDIGVV